MLGSRGIIQGVEHSMKTPPTPCVASEWSLTRNSASHASGDATPAYQGTDCETDSLASSDASLLSSREDLHAHVHAEAAIPSSRLDAQDQTLPDRLARRIAPAPLPQPQASSSASTAASSSPAKYSDYPVRSTFAGVDPFIADIGHGDDASGGPSAPPAFHPDDLRLARALASATQAAGASPVLALQLLLSFSPEEAQDLSTALWESGGSCAYVLACHLHNLRVMAGAALGECGGGGGEAAAAAEPAAAAAVEGAAAAATRASGADPAAARRGECAGRGRAKGKAATGREEEEAAEEAKAQAAQAEAVRASVLEQYRRVVGRLVRTALALQQPGALRLHAPASSPPPPPPPLPPPPPPGCTAAAAKPSAASAPFGVTDARAQQYGRPSATTAGPAARPAACPSLVLGSWSAADGLSSVAAAPPPVQELQAAAGAEAGAAPPPQALLSAMPIALTGPTASRRQRRAQLQLRRRQQSQLPLLLQRQEPAPELRRGQVGDARQGAAAGDGSLLLLVRQAQLEAHLHAQTQAQAQAQFHAEPQQQARARAQAQQREQQRQREQQQHLQVLALLGGAAQGAPFTNPIVGAVMPAEQLPLLGASPLLLLPQQHLNPFTAATGEQLLPLAGGVPSAGGIGGGAAGGGVGGGAGLVGLTAVDPAALQPALPGGVGSLGGSGGDAFSAPYSTYFGSLSHGASVQHRAHGAVLLQQRQRQQVALQQQALLRFPA